MQGKSINGFELQKLLGTGGMAEVWYAENKLGKKAAVKLLLPKYCQDENVNTRFYTEAKVMVDLNHPNIRQVYDYGEIDGRPVIVMEYLDGSDLKDRLKRGQVFTDEELKRWWNQLSSALNYTHKRGIIHRDIKPANIFIDSEGNAKLLDFGIAKVRESISSTQTGQKLGTLMYMSPEQVKDSKHIDYRTDVYSLAVTFVHLVSGKKPYDSDTSSDFEISEQIVYKPLDFDGVSDFWRDFLTPYLNKEVDQRPELHEIVDAPQPVQNRVGNSNNDSDATSVDGPGFYNQPENPFGDDDDLEQRLNAMGGSSTPKTNAPVASNTNAPRKKGWIWILVALVVLLGGGITYLILQQNQEKKERIERLAGVYNEKVDMCDRCLGNMVTDRDGNEASKHFIIQSLLALQEVEKIEQGDSFKEMNVTPVFQEKFETFRKNLRQCEELVNNKYQKQVLLGIEDNNFCIELKDRLDLIREILRQSEGGSAIAINIDPRNNEH